MSGGGVPGTSSPLFNGVEAAPRCFKKVAKPGVAGCRVEVKGWELTGMFVIL
jgi:hypothetical protein